LTPLPPPSFPFDSSPPFGFPPFSTSLSGISPPLQFDPRPFRVCHLSHPEPPLFPHECPPVHPSFPHFFLPSFFLPKPLILPLGPPPCFLLSTNFLMPMSSPFTLTPPPPKTSYAPMSRGKFFPTLAHLFFFPSAKRCPPPLPIFQIRPSFLQRVANHCHPPI